MDKSRNEDLPVFAVLALVMIVATVFVLSGGLEMLQ